MPRPALVLLSGGLDSTTCLAIAAADGFAPIFTLAFDYGQRHRHELAASAELSRRYGAAEHRVITLDLRQFGASALTADIAVPKDRDESAMAAAIPVTYVPARNTIFLSYALAFAEVRRCLDVFIGVNALDYSGYPDCRPEFIAAFEALANVATAAATEHGRRLTIHAPLQLLSKGEIVAEAVRLSVDLALTVSCYDPTPDGAACGHCDSCLLRAQGFADAGIPDPTRYASNAKPGGAG